MASRSEAIAKSKDPYTLSGAEVWRRDHSDPCGAGIPARVPRASIVRPAVIGDHWDVAIPPTPPQPFVILREAKELLLQCARLCVSAWSLRVTRPPQ